MIHTHHPEIEGMLAVFTMIWGINQLNDIQQLNRSDVALLKGDTWDGNEGYALVHRSPALKPNENRLLMTIDFAV